jgi:cytochrome c peroxidase
VVVEYADAYRAAFPQNPLPTQNEIARWPLTAKPGDAAWDALDYETHTQITRIFVDTAKAIAAYERTFRVLPTRFDAYLAGDLAALTSLEKLGLSLFADNGCMQCHWGPRLTDDAFHALGLGTTFDDHDRAFGSATQQHSAFRRGGAWDDSGENDERRSTPEGFDPRLVGQHKTPALRGVADGAFFSHNGSFNDLGAVTSAYGLLADRSDDHVREAWLPFFGETAQWGMLPFLRTLTATTTTTRATAPPTSR